MIVFTVKIELLSNVTTSCSVKCKSRWKVKWLGHTPDEVKTNQQSQPLGPIDSRTPPHKKRKKKPKPKQLALNLKWALPKRPENFMLQFICIYTCL